jgi:hypothetical protein
MDCSHVQEVFSKYYEGELEEDKVELFSEHLRKCQRCAREFELFSSTMRMMTLVERVHAPLYFEKRIRALSERYVKERSGVRHLVLKRLARASEFVLQPGGILLGMLFFCALVMFTLVSRVGEEHSLRSGRHIAQGEYGSEGEAVVASKSLDELNRDLRRLMDAYENQFEMDSPSRECIDAGDGETMYAREGGPYGDSIPERRFIPVPDRLQPVDGSRNVLYHNFVIDSAQIRPIPTVISF